MYDSIPEYNHLETVSRKENYSVSGSKKLLILTWVVRLNNTNWFSNQLSSRLSNIKPWYAMMVPLIVQLQFLSLPNYIFAGSNTGLFLSQSFFEGGFPDTGMKKLYEGIICPLVDISFHNNVISRQAVHFYSTFKKCSLKSL